MVLLLSSEKQDSIRLGRDAGDVYKNSIAVDVTSKLHYGASSHDALNFFEACVCSE